MILFLILLVNSATIPSGVPKKISARTPSAEGYLKNFVDETNRRNPLEKRPNSAVFKRIIAFRLRDLYIF